MASGGAASMNIALASASNFAGEVNQIMICLLLLSMGILILVFGLMCTFAIRYRANSPVRRAEVAERSWRFEIAWTTATMLAFFGLFYWGARVYLREMQPPPGTMKIYVVGKRWMWKVEYPGGQKEIDSIHVPVGQRVQLILTSEDVIHDLAIPAFRVRHDVLPGRYETFWFTATKPGVYHMFCGQLCGVGHSSMVGFVVAMTQPDFQKWLEQNGTSQTLVAAGQQLFESFGCSGCHLNRGTVRAPSLAGLYGSPVPLSNGTITTADEQYLRDSILFPDKQIVASYKPNVMPSYNGKISNGDLEKLIAYIKSLGSENGS
jgi:cytochrome c oxidase subunit II